uniref:Genome polyprotein n=1 Tax=Duck hepacivirus TaxID=2590836 RepID=A0A7D4W1R6_9FLAV|nr:polyprotein [Duck hepacivirus]
MRFPTIVKMEVVDKLPPAGVVRRISRTSGRLQRHLIRFYSRKYLIYRHMHFPERPRSDFRHPVEPVSFTPFPKSQLFDPERTLRCGHLVDGVPVTARYKDIVYLGSYERPPKGAVFSGPKKSAEPGSSTKQDGTKGPRPQQQPTKKKPAQQPKKKKVKAKRSGTQPPPNSPARSRRTGFRDVIPANKGPGIPGINQICSALATLGTRPRRPGDPRNRSNAVGHIVDGVCGAVADWANATPFLGHALGPVADGCCDIIRGVEDVANAGTSKVGFTFFLLCLLLPTPVGASADHICQVGDEVYLSNACRPDQIWFFDGNMALHSEGCVPCLASNHTCFTPWYMTVSYLNAKSYEYWFLRHIDFLVALTYGCDTFGFSEVCATFAACAELIHRHWWVRVAFTCNCSCLETTPPISLHSVFWLGVGDKFKDIGSVLLVLLNVPLTIFRLVLFQYPVSAVVVVMYLVEGRIIKALCIVAILSYSADAGMADRSRTNCTQDFPMQVNVSGDAPPRAVPKSHDLGGLILLPGTSTNFSMGDGNTTAYDCSLGVRVTNSSREYLVYCYSAVVWVNGWKAANVTTISFGSFSHSMTCVIYNCVGSTIQDTAAVCYVDKRKPFCGDCWSDCSHRDVRKTYEACGVSHKIDDYLNFSMGVTKTPVHIFGYLTYVNCSEPPKHHLLRKMPGHPHPVSSEIPVCKGYAFQTGAIGSGLISVRQNKQFITTSLFLYHCSWVSHSVVFCLILSLTGSRIVPFVWFLLTVHLAEGMLSPAPVAAGLAAATLQWGSVLSVVLGVCVFLIAHKTELAPFIIAICKISMGYPALAVAGLIVSCMLPQRSVLGASVSVCLTVHDYWFWNLANYMDWLWFLFLVAILFRVCLLTPLGRRFRLKLLLCSRYVHTRVALRVGRSPLGKYGQYNNEVALISFLFSFTFPKTFVFVYLSVWFCCFCIDMFYLSVLKFVHHRTQFSYCALYFDYLAQTSNYIEARLNLWVYHKLGLPYLFAHINHIARSTASALRKLDLAVNPVGIPSSEIVYHEDRSMRLACGDEVHGIPVCARLGSIIACGFPRHLPKAYSRSGHRRTMQYTAPINATVVRSRGFLKTLAIGVTGRDFSTHEGSIVQLGTGLNKYMGFILGANLVTVYHGSKIRPIATPHGPANPCGYSKEKDTVLYPAPGGMKPLEPCQCSVNTAFICDADTSMYQLRRDDGFWRPMSAMPLSTYKGMSGSPLLCSSGHVIGMLTAVTVVRGVVTKVKIVPVSEISTFNLSVPDAAYTDVVPTVPSSLEIMSYVAPTGSGKSTRLPYQYVQQGHSVLVCNPSVATVTNVVPYMKTTYDMNVNWHCGDADIEVGSKLTYSTYGKVITSDLSRYDVIICDECHSTDPTTVLGIGMILSRVQQTRVKLVLLATATPPGMAVQPHKDIQEVALDQKGSIPFFGATLDIANYRRGRHAIFCGTKAECHRVADALRAAGIHAVEYYRGLSLTVIPNEGDVVVCCTDALMTGYTGNFASVTDCGVSIMEDVVLDFAPTFTTMVKTVPSDAVTRMQRRGRTGRGSPGVYRYAVRTAMPHGIVPEATVMECYDSGYLWYDLDPTIVTTYLRNFNNCAHTCMITASLDVYESFYKILRPFRSQPDCFTAKESGCSFALLTGVQAHLCRQARAPAPSDNPRWAVFRLKGDNPVPLIAQLDASRPPKTAFPPLLSDLNSALGYSVNCSAAYTILSTGVIALGGVAILDSLSCVVVRKDIVLGGHSGVTYIDPSAILDEVLEECSAESWASHAVQHATTWANAVWDKFHKMFANKSAYELWMIRWGVTMTAILGTAQYFASLFVAPRNPALGMVLSAVGIAWMPLPGIIRLMVGLIGGALVSLKGSTMGSTAVTMGAVAGTAFVATSTGGMIFSVLLGMCSTAVAADFTYSLLCGEFPSPYRLLDLATIIAAPGNAVCGVIFALIMKMLLNNSTAQWLNRLLSMHTGKSGPLCENYFVEIKDYENKLRRLMRLASWTHLVEWCANKCQIEEYECNSELFNQIWHAAVWFLRSIIELIQRLIPSVSMPIISCIKPYKGPLSGTGTIVSRCECGTTHSYTVNAGVVTAHHYSSRLCRHSLFGSGVVLTPSARLTCVSYSLPKDGLFTYRYGLSDYVRVQRENGKALLVDSTTGDLSLGMLRYAVATSPVEYERAPLCHIVNRGFCGLKFVQMGSSTVTLPYLIQSYCPPIAYDQRCAPVILIAPSFSEFEPILRAINSNKGLSVSTLIRIPEFGTARPEREGDDPPSPEFRHLANTIKTTTRAAKCVVCVSKYHIEEMTWALSYVSTSCATVVVDIGTESRTLPLTKKYKQIAGVGLSDSISTISGIPVFRIREGSSMDMFNALFEEWYRSGVKLNLTGVYRKLREEASFASPCDTGSSEDEPIDPDLFKQMWPDFKPEVHAYNSPGFHRRMERAAEKKRLGQKPEESKLEPVPEHDTMAPLSDSPSDREDGGPGLQEHPTSEVNVPRLASPSSSPPPQEPPKAGNYCVVVGPPGSGKSSVIRRVKSSFPEAYPEVKFVEFNAPSFAEGAELWDKLRSLLPDEVTYLFCWPNPDHSYEVDTFAYWKEFKSAIGRFELDGVIIVQTFFAGYRAGATLFDDLDPNTNFAKVADVVGGRVYPFNESANCPEQAALAACIANCGTPGLEATEELNFAATIEVREATPSPPPVLPEQTVLLIGLPGSGRTTFAGHLSGVFNGKCRLVCRELPPDPTVIAAHLTIVPGAWLIFCWPSYMDQSRVLRSWNLYQANHSALAFQTLIVWCGAEKHCAPELTGVLDQTDVGWIPHAGLDDDPMLARDSVRPYLPVPDPKPGIVTRLKAAIARLGGTTPVQSPDVEMKAMVKTPVIVCGAGGCGKTTYITNTSDDENRLFSFYEVDLTDEDIVTHWANLHQAHPAYRYVFVWGGRDFPVEANREAWALFKTLVKSLDSVVVLVSRQSDLAGMPDLGARAHPWRRSVGSNEVSPSILHLTSQTRTEVGSFVNPAYEGSADEWDTVSDGSTESCSFSYVWNGVPLCMRKARAFLPVRLMTFGTGNRSLVYYTNPRDAPIRQKKVTVERVDHVSNRHLDAALMRAKIAASRVRGYRLDGPEVAALTNRRTARSCVSGITGNDVKTLSSAYQRAVAAARATFRTGSGDVRLHSCTLSPKVEIFGREREKGYTYKPPRFICYPPLETRAFEKEVFGSVANQVAKAVLGESYGFQYSPFERTSVLLKMWRRYRTPMGFEADAVCFDSKITPQDVRRELEVYQATDSPPDLKYDMGRISALLYEGGKLYNEEGVEVGTRHCRASGVYTTSSSNTLTCFMKMSAALAEVGINDYSILVHGDDVIVITESDPLNDISVCQRLTHVLGELGLPQATTIKPCYSLEDISTCSSNVTVSRTYDGRLYYHLTRNPLHPMARAAAETSVNNPADRWVGQIMQFAPCLWVRWVVVQWLENLCHRDDGSETVQGEFMGNTMNIPIKLFPALLTRLHGPDVFNVKSYSAQETSRTNAIVRELGYDRIRVLKRRAIRLRVRIIRNFPRLRPLLPLIGWCINKPYFIDRNLVDATRQWDVTANPYANIEIGKVKTSVWRKVLAVPTTLAMAVFLTVLSFLVLQHV